MGLSPEGRFLYAAGSLTGKLTAYAINQESGALTAQAKSYDLGSGSSPGWILSTKIG